MKHAFNHASSPRGRESGDSPTGMRTGRMTALAGITTAAVALFASPVFAQELPPEYETAPEVVFQPAFMLEGVDAIVRHMIGHWSLRQADARDSFGRLEAFDADVGSGGVWVRVGTDWGSSEVRRSLPVEGADPVALVNDYDQDIQSINAGVDLVRGTAEDGRRWLAGATVGYARSTQEFERSGTELDYDNVGAGLYTSYVGKHLFVDVLLRYDWTKADADMPALAIQLDDPVLGTDVQSASLHVDAGWRIPVSDVLRVEPMVGLSWTRIRPDDLNIIPTDPLTNGPEGDTVKYDRQENRRASLGVRGSFLQPLGAMHLEYALTGRYWHDFERDTEARIHFRDEDFDLDISHERESGYGEVIAGVSANRADGKLAGVLNLHGRFSGDTSAYGATVGLRYQW